MKRENNRIDIRCVRCNQKIMEYQIQGDDDSVVLAQGLSISCHRCKRVATLRKYTEGMIKERTENGSFRI